MDSILDELYESLPQPDSLRQEKKQALWKEYFPLCQRVQDAFGLEFVDRLTQLKGELDRQEDLSQFRRGFRLGVRLTLEALGLEHSPQ